jgi:predicted RNA-binding Zn ribbon-like protein
MAIQSDAAFRFDLCGGYLAIDFANTVESRHTANPIERLTDYPALVAFSEQSGLIDAQKAARLRAWAAAEPRAAAAIAAQALELRDALYAIFSAIAEHKDPPPASLEVLNRAWGSLQLGPSFTWQWSAGPEAPDAMLGQVLISAVELLNSPRRERIRGCGADDCLWLFLDTSKNASRRWCDMNQCGNRTKARRFYRRQREASDQ